MAAASSRGRSHGIGDTPRPRPPGTLDLGAGVRKDDLMDEVSAAFGLFGREDALRVVDDVLVGGGNVVAIGEPGAGKSSLLRASAQLAKVRGRRVLAVT